MSDVIPREVVVEAIKRELARCERQIAEYSLKMAAEPQEAVMLACDIARHGFTSRIWELAMEVIDGKRELLKLEASLSSRLLNLCGRSAPGQIDRVLTDQIEMGCIEDALDRTGAIGLLRSMDGMETQRSSQDVGSVLKGLLDPANIEGVVALAWPGLDADDRADREEDVRNVVKVLIERLG